MATTSNILFCLDQDNTLLTNRDGWDTAFMATSQALLGQSFRMTTTPSGKHDFKFSEKAPFEILQERMLQIGLDPKSISEKDFYDCLDHHGAAISYHGLAHLFANVDSLIEMLRQLTTMPLLIVSSGSRKMQTRVLKDLGLSESFDLEHSRFGQEFPSKTAALAHIANLENPRTLVYFGDSPSDMRAINSEKIRVEQRLAVGVTIAGLTQFEDLEDAGAKSILKSFNHTTLQCFKQFVTELF